MVSDYKMSLSCILELLSIEYDGEVLIESLATDCLLYTSPSPRDRG